MASRHPTGAFVISLIAACGSSTRPPAVRPNAPPPQRFAEGARAAAFADPARRAKLEAAFPTIEAAIESNMKGSNVPGLAVAIVIDGETVYAKGFGITDVVTKTPARADTVYRIGSITKSFTGLAILSLRDQGVLGIDDPLVKWLPEAAGLIYPSRDAQPLTLRQLLDHSSGLPRMGSYDPENGPKERDLAGSLAGLSLDRAPGVASVYSNLGFSLLGIVVGRAARRNYHAVIAERIWKPLGMTSTYWEFEEVPAERLAPAYRPSPKGPEKMEKLARLGAGDGAGGIYSTVEDMARYVAFQLDAYPPRDDAETGSIRRSSRREAHSTGIHGTTRVALAPGAKPGDPLVHMATGTYGFGWGREENCYFDELVTHGGAIDSYRADVSFLPSRGVGVVVMTNFGEADPGGLSRLVLDELRKTGALEARREPLDPAFERAAKEFIPIMNEWDEAKLKAWLDPNRPPLPEEKDEIVGYHALHGTCTGLHAVEGGSKTQANVELECERGTLELMMQLDPKSRKSIGFLGTSRGVTAPPALASAATAIAGLVAKWDDAVYQQYLSKAEPPHDVMKEGLAALGAAHGACVVTTPIHVGFDWGFELDCERGGGMRLTVVLDPADKSTVRGLGFHPRQEGMCPVR